MSFIKNKRIETAIGIVVLVLILAGAAIYIKKANNTSAQPGPIPVGAHSLAISSDVPIGLIGKVVSIDNTTVTIEAVLSPGAAPVKLTALVDAKTNITKVGPAPGYATSTAAFSDFKDGMLLNISATEAQNGVRHAEHIIIPPQAE